MQLSEFFIIRDKFLSHVRRKLKGIRYDLKRKTFESDIDSFFKDFPQSNLLTEIGKTELATLTVKELIKQTADIRNRIKPFEEQIELTHRSHDTNTRKNKFIAEQNSHIDYWTNKYTPKFPSRDQNTFLLSSFDLALSRDNRTSHAIFLGFKQKCEIGPDVDVSVIGDAVFAKLKDHNVSKEPFNKKDKMVWEEM